MQDLVALGLGLDYGTVRLVAAPEEWRAAGNGLAQQLATLLGDRAVSVEHVGSTAVPGLLAKPILDLAVGVTGDPHPDILAGPLSSAGWEYRGDAGEDGGLIFVLEARTRHRVAHLHVVNYGGEQWRNYLSFSALLRDDSHARARYEARKRSLQAEAPNDRAAYQSGKTGIVEAILSDLPACDW